MVVVGVWCRRQAILNFFMFVFVADWRELSGDLFEVTQSINQRCIDYTKVRQSQSRLCLCTGWGVPGAALSCFQSHNQPHAA